MNNNNFTDAIQKAFRITIGATASVVETLQNPEKINGKIDEFNTQWQELSSIWAQKGAVTEEEAKSLIEKFFQQQANSTTSSQTNSSTATKSNSSADIRRLTQDVISLKEELQKANSQG